ncbi:MAG: hypothetical protein RL171_1318, partial [Pseudomonadota bacterium]
TGARVGGSAVAAKAGKVVAMGKA